MGEFPLSFTWLCLPINFLACAGFAALNEISIELEEPFGTDANDYPIHIQQWNAIQAMEDLFFQEQPKDFDLACFGDDHPTLEQEVQASYRQSVSRKSTMRPPMNMRKAANTAASEALSKKFEELRNTITAATRWLQKHRSNGQAAVADQAHLMKLIEVLEQALAKESAQSAFLTSAQSFKPTSRSSGGGAVSDPVAARHAALYDNFADAYDLGYANENSPANGRTNTEELTGEALAEAVQEIIDSSTDQALREELSALVQQHMAASRILEMAQDKRPELFIPLPEPPAPERGPSYAPAVNFAPEEDSDES